MTKPIDEAEFRELYFDRMERVVDIAGHFNVCTGTIHKRLRNLGWQREKLSLVEDISGQRFGRIVALWFSHKDRFGKAIWEVRCDCGREKKINASGMKAGLVVSCGCAKRERLRSGHKDLSGSYWRKIQKAAAQRDLEFAVTMQEAWALYERQQRCCALSGVLLTMVPNNDRYYDQTASFDRIDSTLGYTTGNVQWVHKRVNMLKKAMPERELIFWCAQIAGSRKADIEDLDVATLRERRSLHADIKSHETERPLHALRHRRGRYT